MFIYKITVIPINKIYIGLDTHEEYKRSRWKTHCRNVKNFEILRTKTKLYKAMFDFGIENCRYEIIANNFTNLKDLALAEIKFIEQYDSYKNGLNSSYGGDGLGYSMLHLMSEDDITEIKYHLGQRFSEYNKNQKWANTTIEQRKDMVTYLLDPMYIKQRTQTLKEYYNAHPEAKIEKGKIFKNWISENKDTARQKALNASKKALESTQRFVTVKLPSGTIKTFSSRREFHRETGQWFETLLKKGTFNGYKLIDYATLDKNKIGQPLKPMIVRSPFGIIETYSSRKEFTNKTGISYFYILKKGNCRGYTIVNYE